MSKRIIVTVGLPGSGKSTFAKWLLADEPGQWKRINKDDLRAQLDNGKWSKGNEQFIINARDALIREALIAGYNIIVDDTNLHPKHIAHIREITKDLGTVEVKDFTDVPIETCIARDTERGAKYGVVGEKVIRSMYNQFLKPAPLLVEWNEELPTTLLVDLDGTLALFGDANPYDRDFSQDILNPSVSYILKTITESTSDLVIVVSGRTDKFIHQTRDWLDVNKVPYSNLYMRKDGDTRKDVIVKEEIYRNEIEGKFNIRLVIDDRLQVCRLWHSLGLPLLRFGDPDADF